MVIHEEKNGTVFVLTVSDRLDSATSPEFEQQLLGVIEAGEHRILLDLTGVDYMNSAGLKALLVAAKKLSPVKGQLVLCGLAANVATVFDLTGFNHLFNIKPDRASGLSAFS